MSIFLYMWILNTYFFFEDSKKDNHCEWVYDTGFIRKKNHSHQSSKNFSLYSTLTYFVHALLPICTCLTSGDWFTSSSIMIAADKICYCAYTEFRRPRPYNPRPPPRPDPPPPTTPPPNSWHINHKKEKKN